MPAFQYLSDLHIKTREQIIDIFSGDAAKLEEQWKNARACDFRSVCKSTLYDEMRSLLAEDYREQDVQKISDQMTEAVLSNIEKKMPELYILIVEEDSHALEQDTNQKVTKLLENQNVLQIEEYGSLDAALQEETANPSIGLSFFNVDDTDFQDSFDKLVLSDQQDMPVVVESRNCREESVYLVLNELKRIGVADRTYVVKDRRSWAKIKEQKPKGQILIPWFDDMDHGEIDFLPGHLNIFILTPRDQDTYEGNGRAVELRPRKRDSVIDALLAVCEDDSNRLNRLMKQTQGNYPALKRRLILGLRPGRPDWITAQTRKAVQTAVLLGAWQEEEGDKGGY